MNNILLSQLNQAKISDLLQKLSATSDIPNVKLDAIDTAELQATLGLCPQCSFFVTQGSAPLGFFLSSVRKTHGDILFIYVRPDFRRQHLGQSILSAGLSLLKQHHIKTLSLEVMSDNAAAVGLYRNNGFVKTGAMLVMRNETNSFYQLRRDISIKPRPSLLVLPTLRMFTANTSFRRELYLDSNILCDMTDNGKAEFVSVLSDGRCIGYMIFSRKHKTIHIYHYGFNTTDTADLFAAISAVIQDETIVALRIPGDDEAGIYQLTKNGFYKDIAQDIYSRRL